ncbi:DUF6507 family protein [Saccharothrix sp. NRRL B-16348]|uniref:DUF6507 family protein n=1 Tax=Saccharothrix sp. NRRL B-16348 TaxID=1415542 RepID=UPI0006AE21A4|nr:DUF6507 family protein [Saccharothrix sp. NRRL B-16348]
MTKWDISPDGVRSVLARTEAVAKDFEHQMAALNSALQQASVQSNSVIVAEALGGFADAKMADIEFVFTRIGACLNGAAQATNAYLEGDLEMAANAQTAVTAAPDPQATMPHGGNKPR